MPPRIHTSEPLHIGATLELPPAAARHVQVLRLQPGDTITLFPGANPRGNQEFAARITAIGRQSVQAQVQAMHVHNREAMPRIHLLAGMPANDRMDWLVEKATELGVSSITPIAAERSVLKLKGERAEKRQAQWQAAAIAACEQCERNTIPAIHAPTSLLQWLAQQPCTGDSAISASHRIMLHPRENAPALATWNAARLAAHDRHSPDTHDIHVLSGPEGGLSPAEVQAARQAGFIAVELGPRILRAETAPLAALAYLTQSSICTA